ncbi:MAG: potassium-transporting ATPase subunit F [Leptospirales bacterium]
MIIWSLLGFVVLLLCVYLFYMLMNAEKL